MATKNNYVLEYVSFDLLWYERDGLMTWSDQRKCEKFLRDPERHFKDTEIVNFDIIYREMRGEKVPKVFWKSIKPWLKREQKNIPRKSKIIFCRTPLGQKDQIFILIKGFIYNHFYVNSKKIFLINIMELLIGMTIWNLSLFLL